MANQCLCGYIAPDKPISQYTKAEVDALVAHQDAHLKLNKERRATQVEKVHGF